MNPNPWARGSPTGRCLVMAQLFELSSSSMWTFNRHLFRAGPNRVLLHIAQLQSVGLHPAGDSARKPFELGDTWNLQSVRDHARRRSGGTRSDRRGAGASGEDLRRQHGGLGRRSSSVATDPLSRLE